MLGGERTRWMLRRRASWAARRDVSDIALEVLRPALAVVAVPVHRLGPATPSAPAGPSPVSGQRATTGNDDEPRDLVVGGRRVPGPDVERAHRALEALHRAAAPDGGPGPGAAASPAERVLLDPTVDRDWWIVTRLAPWSHGMTGFDHAGRHLFDAAKDERLLLLRLTPTELASVRARISAAGGDPDLVTRPRAAGGEQLRWWDVLAKVFLLSLLLTGWLPDRIADLRDGYSTAPSTAVDLLLLTLLTLMTVVLLRELVDAARTGLRLRRRRTLRDGSPRSRRRPGRGATR